jgi:hypothetical protein
MMKLALFPIWQPLASDQVDHRHRLAHHNDQRSSPAIAPYPITGLTIRNS